MATYIVTLAFNHARILEACLEKVYETIGIVPDKHLVLNNHFPVNKEENDQRIKAICERFGCTYYESESNTGLQAGYNFLLKELNLQSGDVVIGIDNDCFPVSPGWGQALLKVHEQKDIGWASLSIEGTTERECAERGFEQLDINGVTVVESKAALMNSICAWKAEMLEAVGGLKEPRKYYGGVECQMKPMLRKAGFRWVYLKEYLERPDISVSSDDAYRTYKVEYVYGKTELDFEGWLKAKPHDWVKVYLDSLEDFALK